MTVKIQFTGRNGLDECLSVSAQFMSYQLNMMIMMMVCVCVCVCQC